MSIMNAPSREFCVARRERTNTPLQALVLMNEPEYFKLAQSCAKRTLSETKGHRQKTLIRLYERITSHPPSTHDLALLNQSLDQFLLHYKNNPELGELLGRWFGHETLEWGTDTKGSQGEAHPESDGSKGGSEGRQC